MKAAVLLLALLGLATRGHCDSPLPINIIGDVPAGSTVATPGSVTSGSSSTSCTTVSKEGGRGVGWGTGGRRHAFVPSMFEWLAAGPYGAAIPCVWVPRVHASGEAHHIPWQCLLPISV